MTESKHGKFALELAKLPAVARLGVSFAVGFIAAFVLPHSWKTELRLVASWDAIALTLLSLIWFTIIRLEPKHIQRVARMEDPSRAVSLGLVVVGAAAALLAVVVLLNSAGKMQDREKSIAITLAIAAVVLAWFLIHTVFTLRYAHIYHGEAAEDTGDTAATGSVTAGTATTGTAAAGTAGTASTPTATTGSTANQSDDESAGGLDFPQDAECPEYLDFAYFAFTIGMTAQTADIAVTSQKMRRNVLLHGILSFAFNTAVVALSIGVLTTLLQG